MNKSIFILILTICLSILSNNVLAENIPISYAKLENSPFTENQEQNTDYEVLYFFSYGCPFCFQFEKYLNIYLKNKKENVDMTYKPLIFSEAWEQYAKAYYIADSLELDIHEHIFKNIHEEKNKMFFKKDLEKYFATHYNTSAEDFSSAYNSYLVTYKLNKNETLADFYNVTATPTIIITDKNNNVYKLSPSISDGLYGMVSTLLVLTLNKI